MRLQQIIDETLHIKLEQATVEYIFLLIQDEQITQEEKLETIRGIVELEVEQPSESGSTCTIDQSILQLLRLASSEELTNELDQDEPDQNQSIPPTSPDIQTNHDQDIKKSILAVYATVEDDQLDTTASQISAKELKAAEEARQSMLDQQLKLLDLKSKTRKKAEAKFLGDPLLRPNLNAALVQHETKLKREEAASKARAKSEKDKTDLLKQRESQAKKKVDARARASKGERKA